MNGLSLFSSAGIGELHLNRLGIDIKVSNELIKRRAALYQTIHKNTKIIQGDITNKKVYEDIISTAKKNKIDFILATPPCQGFSLIGKNKNLEQMQKDKRNYLLNYVVSSIKELNPKYILIENVPRFLNMYFKHGKQFLQPTEFLVKELGEKYEIVENVFNSNDFNVPQDRKRALIRLYKKGLTWKDPVTSNARPTLRDAIGHLPSIESGEHSNIPWHYGRVHSERHINAMQLTPEGKSAFEFNNILKSENGKIPKGFKTTYARMEWDKPCPTITMRNDAISSQRNVHPGRKLKNGKYSDARVLSIKELFLLTGLGNSFTLPKDTSEMLIRQVIGEAVPPKLIHAVCKGIFQ